MKIGDAFGGKYIKCADLGGEEKRYTVKSVRMEQIGGSKEEETVKPVCRFKEIIKGLVLNQINAETIKDQCGDETDNWIGRQIILRPAKTNFGGKLVDCVRVAVPKQEPQRQPDEEPDEGPDELAV